MLPDLQQIDRRVWWITATGFAALVILLPAVGPGPLLTLDNVAAPGQMSALLGVPVQTTLLQRIVLVLAILPGLLGSLVLARARSFGAIVGVSLFWMSNLFVAERLAIGQWQVLAAIGGLPWLLLSIRGWHEQRRWQWLVLGGAIATLMLTLYPRAFSFLHLVALVAIAVPWIVGAERQHRAHRTAWVIGGWIFASALLHLVLPWLGDLRVDQADPTSAQLFQLGSGSVGERLIGAISYLGFWAERAGRLPLAIPEGWWLVLPGFLLLPLAVLGWRRLLLTDRTRWLGQSLVALYVASLLLTISSVVADSVPGLSQIWDWLGFIGLRETGKFMGGMLVAQAIGLGVELDALWQTGRRWSLGVVLGVVAVLLLQLPTALALSRASLTPVQYPAELLTLAVTANAAQERVILLPWHRYQRYSFTNGRVVDQLGPGLFAKHVFNELTEYGPLPVNPTDDWQVRMAAATGESRLPVEEFSALLAEREVDVVVIFKTNDYERYLAWAQAAEIEQIADTLDLASFRLIQR